MKALLLALFLSLSSSHATESYQYTAQDLVNTGVTCMIRFGTMENKPDQKAAAVLCGAVKGDKLEATSGRGVPVKDDWTIPSDVLEKAFSEAALEALQSQRTARQSG